MIRGRSRRHSGSQYSASLTSWGVGALEVLWAVVDPPPDDAVPVVDVDAVGVGVVLPLEETRPPLVVDAFRRVVELPAEDLAEVVADAVWVVAALPSEDTAVAVEVDAVWVVVEMAPDDTSAPVDPGAAFDVVELLPPHPARTSVAARTAAQPVHVGLLIANPRSTGIGSQRSGSVAWIQGVSTNAVGCARTSAFARAVR